jgi:hypothetical protein
MIWNHSSGQDDVQSALWWPRWHISRLYMSYWLDFGDSLCVCHNTMHNCIVHTLSGMMNFLQRHVIHVMSVYCKKKLYLSISRDCVSVAEWPTGTHY